MSFQDLGLSPRVLKSVENAGFINPTPIQIRAIPFAVQGRDVVGVAQTGTGKTASFVLPMLTRLERGRARARIPRSLILEPTRELAAQVAEAFEALGSDHKLNVALLIGGVSFDEQDRKLGRGADVVIATPGRLLDHFGRGKLLLNGVEILVIDEADRMLDMGFIPDIERICKLLPITRQTLFFSATMPPEIQRLTEKFLSAPERIAVTPPATAAGTITQKFSAAPSDPKAKRNALRELIRSQDIKNAIIFCNRKRDVITLYQSLKKHGFNVGALHGDMDQHNRMATLEAFRNGEITFLAASDVAARGLDIPEVSHIFNYDVPLQADDYVHRIGRTGRAGRLGFAATLVTPADKKYIRGLKRICGETLDWIGEPPGVSEKQSDGKRKDRGQVSRNTRPKRRQPRSNDKSDKPSANEPGHSGRPGSKTKPAAKPSKRRASKKEPSEVGMGQHVPEFMKRPIRSTN